MDRMIRMSELASDPAVEYADFTASLSFDRLPDGVVEVLKRIVLDTLGTTLAGGTLGSGCLEVLQAARATGGAGASTIIGYGDQVGAPLAALANGAMAHALNYDDVYPGGGHL